MLTKSTFRLLCTIGIAVNAIGLFTGVMMIDGALYALIAKNMVLSGNYLFLTLHGFDWLDKPHFQFWCTALSYHVFGINDFAYKFPAFIFWLIGAWYTYLLADKLYGRKAAQVGVLVYLSSLHLILCNSAVNAEPYLTGMIIASVYHLYRVYQRGSFGQLVLGALWASMAVMTKGIFVLILIGSGFMVLWIIRKEWKQFLNYRWYVAFAFVLLFILPELYSLYSQFDARPEVEVFGRKNVSGLRFFFWDSQFGRFFNTGPITGHGDPFFYLHTVLWAFLPWSILLLFTVYFSVNRWKGIAPHPLLWGAVFVPFLMFSASEFQLPHYLNALFPMMSIWVAQLLVSLDRLPASHVIHRVQWYLAAVLIPALCALTFLFHDRGWMGFVGAVAVAGVAAFFFFRRPSVINTLAISYSTGILIGVFYGAYLYPGLLAYQGGSAMGDYINTHLTRGPRADRLYVLDLDIRNFTLGFRSDIPLQAIRSAEQWDAVLDGSLLAVADLRLNELPDAYKITEIATFSDYRVSRITPKFFYYRTREAQLGKFHLVRLTKKPAGPDSDSSPPKTAD
ncbi:ArnT family glycosyltransferase [Parapedobacter deserti]|uniref:ArnT family glycosyltransferase n=1 Tax=Parapedobacter deserti TaxID=1912957 RepID=A0ABV7JJB0_9SPHI